jgi:hypothetical protein
MKLKGSRLNSELQKSSPARACANLVVSAARPALPPRQVLAARRLQERRREDLRREPRVYHFQRMTLDDWPALCGGGKCGRI